MQTAEQNQPMVITDEDEDNNLTKGTWTSQEDNVLAAYVTKFGEGDWKVVKKSIGINRSAKSCRLRWRNHLRPNLKKGRFTPEEEIRIINLHAELGNKWAQIATQMPGRTDNDIKNYVNNLMRKANRTRSKTTLQMSMFNMSQSVSQIDHGQEATFDRSKDSHCNAIETTVNPYNMQLDVIPDLHGSDHVDSDKIMEECLMVWNSETGFSHDEEYSFD